MDSAAQTSFCCIVVALFGSLLFLRLWFPNASRKAETVVLILATAIFFAACNHLFSAAI